MSDTTANKVVYSELPEAGSVSSDPGRDPKDDFWAIHEERTPELGVIRLGFYDGRYALWYHGEMVWTSREAAKSKDIRLE